MLFLHFFLDDLSQSFNGYFSLILFQTIEEVLIAIAVQVNFRCISWTNFYSGYEPPLKICGFGVGLIRLYLLLSFIPFVRFSLEVSGERVVSQWNKGNRDIGDFRLWEDEAEHIVYLVLDGFLILFTKETAYRQNLPVLPYTIEKDYTSVVVQHSANGLEYLCLVIANLFSKREYLSGHQLIGTDQISIVVIEKLGAAKTAKLWVPAVFNLFYHFSNILLVDLTFFQAKCKAVENIHPLRARVFIVLAISYYCLQWKIFLILKLK